MHTLFRWPLLLATVALVSLGCGSGGGGAADPPATAPLPVSTAINLPYVAGDSLAKHTLDIYRPQGATAARVVVFVPGGAWRQGDKSLYTELGQTLAAYHGYVVVAVNYRLSNDQDGQAVHPDHVDDVAAACRWIRDHIAEHGGDPARLYLFGQSAGAHLVSLLIADGSYLERVGLSPASFRAVVAMSGAYSLANLQAFPANPLGLTAEETLMYKAILLNAFGSLDRAALDAASPSVRMRAGRPPFLVFTTETDLPGFDADGKAFAATTASLGVVTEMRRLVRSDYSDATWQKATEMAAAEPVMAAYIGHYAEVVAINGSDRSRPPTPWIASFINAH